MSHTAKIIGVALLGGLYVSAALGQEGFPLDGTWRGTWGDSASDRQTTVVIVMSWDGVSINGLINPGRDSMPIEKAFLDVSDWSIRIEAMSREGQSIVIEGVLDRIGAYDREVNGTWTVDNVEYRFRMARE